MKISPQQHTTGNWLSQSQSREGGRHAWSPQITWLNSHTLPAGQTMIWALRDGTFVHVSNTGGSAITLSVQVSR